MNPSLRRNTCENVINKEPIGSTIAAKSKLEPKSPVIAYDYEAAISQPDIPICSNIDNNTLNPSWSEQSDELSAPTKKRNFYVRGKTGLTTKKKGIVFKSKIQAKKVTHIKKELIPSSKIIRNVENYIQKNNDDGVTPNCHMPLNQNLVLSRDVRKSPEIAKNGKNLTSKATSVFQENFNKINKDTKSGAPQNISKIPRIKPPIKPNSFLSTHGESPVYPSAKLSLKNELKFSTEFVAVNEEEKIFDSKRETLYALDYKKTKNILPILNENSNFWCPEKSSEMDADEEFEGDLLTSTKESPVITSAGDDPRSATLLKSLALKCECRSCNDHKYASTVRTDQHTETESWISPEIESTRKWKSMRHRKFIDASSEDLDLLPNYNTINYNKTNGKNNGSNFAGHITKQSSIVNHTKMKTYQKTNFFNVFFDIVFWPFVFLRAKQ
ncbi:PREDICTED: uncharacterized protein LOC108757802 isoform X2 [Trachymyrmex cornetzi]|uniref:uncharacterized protein LOC108757802 isoform X2 n=1 Tax=Trachymyrmex cornetzi TaxID=471704 RepID=UPI00084F09C5|nr:PREDICTED: uncharacterized protein LOC108757802 isoform X2 [Trachymyrmex cornetzi]